MRLYKEIEIGQLIVHEPYLRKETVDYNLRNPKEDLWIPVDFFRKKRPITADGGHRLFAYHQNHTTVVIFPCWPFTHHKKYDKEENFAKEVLINKSNLKLIQEAEIALKVYGGDTGHHYDSYNEHVSRMKRYGVLSVQDLQGRVLSEEEFWPVQDILNSIDILLDPISDAPPLPWEVLLEWANEHNERLEFSELVEIIFDLEKKNKLL